jgi:hypothetical protein
MKLESRDMADSFTILRFGAGTNPAREEATP